MTEKSYLSVAGAQLECVRHGPSADQAPTLIFLHEGLGCIDMWHDFPQKLSALTGCGSLVYSRLGYGGSDPCEVPRPLSYMHDEGLQVLPGLIKAAGIRQHILIGHSDGGSIAIINAGGARSDSLLGVITESAHVFCEALSVQSIDAAKVAFEQSGLDLKLQKYHRDNTECAFWGWNNAWLDPEFMYWNIEEYLPKIGVPILAIQGVDDQYGTEDQILAIKSQAGAQVEVCMLEHCGHSPHREQEEETLRVMSQFIKKLIQT